MKLGMRHVFWLGYFLSSQSLWADLFHYNNLLIGDRAIGMGGAYTAVSDDSSGVYYNPAGLAFAVSNDLSGSANAFVQKSLKYKRAIADRDFEEVAGGSVPSFFGGLQKLDNFAKGLVFAFGIYFPDSELKDQETLIDDQIDLGAPAGVWTDASGTPLKDSDGNIQEKGHCYDTAGIKGGQRPNVFLQRFHRTSNQRGSSMYAGGALGWRVTNNLSIGLGVNYISINDLMQEYQDTRSTTSLCSNAGAVLETTSQLGQNKRQNLVAKGLQTVLGMQLAFLSRFSLGVTVKSGKYLSQGFEYAVEKRVSQLLATDQAAADTAGKQGSYSSVNFAQILQQDYITKVNKPLGSLPGEIRLGLAYFASSRLLISSDLAYIQGVSDSDAQNVFGKNPVINFATGLEYYVLPAFPLRLGYLTNNDARPKVNPKKGDQPDHIDYQGVSSFLAWVQPNSQIGIGVVYQTGKGSAQKTGGTATQNIEGSAMTFAFSATHSL